MSVKTYTGQKIDVSFDTKRCIHAAECVRRLPAVFDTSKRPWIQPDNATTDDITAVVEKCPSGALQYQHHDQATLEQPDDVNTITIEPDGPVYIRGRIQLEVGGETRHETRLALCRCGLSQNKPYCDNSHKEGNFQAQGQLPTSPADPEAEQGGSLTITPLENGPVMLKGNFEICDDKNESVYQSQKAALCRCGGSMNKPFCDGTHRTIEFEATP